MWKYVVCWVLALLGMFVVGCESEGHKAFVSGEVRVDGLPPEKGSISFIPVDGKSPTTGTEILAGKYEAPCPVGKSKVEIRIPRKIGSRKLYDTPDSPIQDTFEEVLPAKFNTQTELIFSAEVGNNKKDWDLSTAVEAGE